MVVVSYTIVKSALSKQCNVTFSHLPCSVANWHGDDGFWRSCGVVIVKNVCPWRESVEKLLQLLAKVI